MGHVDYGVGCVSVEQSRIERIGAVLHQAFTHALQVILFQRVGLDLAPRGAGGFTFEEAVQLGLGYLPSLEPEPGEVARDLGEQPIARLMAELGLKPSDLVKASTEQITHRMVSRALKGRRLTANTMDKVQRALQRAAGSDHSRGDLFNYEP